MINFSVLMSVYCNDNPDFFREALESVTILQTVKPQEVIIVEDGYVSDEIEKNIHDIEKQDESIHYEIIKIEKNSGLASALNEGLKFCKYDWIARMDADDIAVADRFKIQTAYLNKNPHIAVLGGAIEEFEFKPGDIDSKRLLATKYLDIKKIAQTRNPINHMTVFINRNILKSMCGYPTDTDKLEDYKLWVEMLVNGYIIENVDETLVYSRIGNGFIFRRSCRREIEDWDKLQEYMRFCGFISFFQAKMNKILIRCFINLPSFLKKLVYRLILRGGGVNGYDYFSIGLNRKNKQINSPCKSYVNGLISVITPVYNASKYLDKAILSVINQTYKNIEYILVDDCSTDQSIDTIRMYQKQYPMIRCVRTPINSGSGIARNTGISEAKGRYIAFLDSDDIWEKDKLEKQILLFEAKKGIPLVYTAINYIDENGNKLKEKRSIKERIGFNYLLKNTVIATSSVIIDRYVLSHFEMPNRRSGEDYSLWLSILREYGDAYGINEDLVSYRKSSTSVSHNKIHEVKHFFYVQTQDMKIGSLKASWNTLCYVLNAVKKHYF